MAATLGRIQYSLSAEEAVTDCQLVVEAIVENMDTKHTLFKSLDKAAPRLLPGPCNYCTPLSLSLSFSLSLSQCDSVCQQHLISLCL